MKKIFLFLYLMSFSFLAAQTDDSWKLFDDSRLARVDITIDPARLQWIYANVQSDSEHVASFRFRNYGIDETVDTVGFRLRGNTSRNSKKKSFKVSFNSFQKGKQFHGIEKLNLNGEHNDPSIIRSKLSFDLFHDIGLPASRASHVRVYINGAYYGLYISVEHIDEEFLSKNFTDDSGNLWKCLYPADLKYLGADPALYKRLMNNPTTPAYDLSTNETGGDFSTLIRLIDILNNTPASSLADSVDRYLVVYRILQYFAMNTLVGSWDDYRSLMNNYYLYHIPSEDKFTLIPYDYDNTFGIDWSGKDWSTANPYAFPKVTQGARPLAERLLDNDQYRDLFTHFLRYYHEKVFLLPLWDHRITRIKDSITTAVQEDTYRTQDWGFSMNDFHNSYSSLSYNNQHVKFGLRQFINARNTSLPSQLNDRNAPPLAYRMDISPRHPRATDSIYVTAACFSTTGIKEIRLQCSFDNSSITRVSTMRYAPVASTLHVEEADRWVGVLPPLGEGITGRITITLQDSIGRTQAYPRTGGIMVRTGTSNSRSIIINEFLADNTSIPDPAGQYDDWLELYNPTATPVVLTNMFLTDKPGNLTKWQFRQPNLTLAPGKYLVLWCDEDTAQSGIHTNFKLSAGGEYIALVHADGVTVLDSLTFGQQKPNISYGRLIQTPDRWEAMLPTPGTQNSVSTSVDARHNLPTTFSLHVFPNPFNPSTTIRCSFPAPGMYTLRIFDLLGREVWKVIDKAEHPGTYSFRWDGKVSNGNLAGSGIYFLQASLGSQIQTLKLVMVK